MDKTLELLLQNSSDIVFILDKSFTITAISKAAINFCKRTRSAIINKNFFTIFSAQNIPTPFTQSKLLTAITKKIFSITRQHDEHDDNCCTIKWAAQPLQDSKSILLLGKDVSITKNEIRNYFANILDCIPGILYCKDLDGNYLWCNQFMLNSLGINSLSAIVGKTDADIWPQCAPKLQQSDRAVIKEGRMMPVEEMIAHHNGTEIYCTGMKMPLRNANNKIVGVIGNALNITHLKRIEAELREAKEKAEQANEANDEKNKFISNMEHDLRTPCIGILQTINFLESTKNIKIAPTVNKAMEYIAQAANQLLELLDAVLHFSYMKSDELPIELKAFDIKKIVYNIVTLESPLAKEKNLQLTGNCSNKIPSTIVSDKHRIQRILINLISNAIKFTERGYVKVTMKIAKRIDKKKLLLQISVKDTGIGIPQDKQEAIYERFVRAIPENSANKFKGSGLGLNIVRQFLRDLDGEISVKSRDGKGTEFICLLPVEILSLEEKRLNANTFSDNSLTAGLEDDNSCSLSSSRLEPTVNPTAALGKQLAKSPSINTGLSFTAQEQNPLLQPYSQRDLKILLVEDNQLIQQVTKIMVSNFAKKLDTADTGKLAIALAKQNTYDLAFIDIDLPDTDGYSVAKNIRKFNPTMTLVALTAYTTTTAKDRSLASGINDFLSKPLNNEKMLYVINKWIKPKANTEDNEKSASTPTINTTPTVTSSATSATVTTTTTSTATSSNPATASPTNNGKIISLELGAQFVGNDRKKAEELIGLMLKNFDAKHQELKTNYANKNWKQLERTIHHLRGSIVYCGTPNLQIASAQLHGYLATKSRKQPTIIEKLYKQFIDEVEKVRALYNNDILTKSPEKQ